jgi:hypothetical protein
MDANCTLLLLVLFFPTAFQLQETLLKVPEGYISLASNCNVKHANNYKWE